MAHDSYITLINLAIDGALAPREHEELNQHVQTCAACAAAWEKMSQIDTLFKVQPQVAPPPEFIVNVMAQVGQIEARKRWRPWFIAGMVAILVSVLTSVALPVLFFTLKLYLVVLALPWVGNALAWVLGMLTRTLSLAADVYQALVGWVSFLVGDPTALAVVVGALVIASTWIGLLEAVKHTPAREMSSLGA